MTPLLRALTVLAAATAFLPVASPLAAQQSRQGGRLEIVGSTRLGEQGTGSWGARWETPPTRTEGGIQPATPGFGGVSIAAEWEDPPRYRWDFGDGTPPVETDLRSGVTHQYLQDGTYTIRVTATSGEESESATLDVTVLNRAPRVLGIQALELPSAEAVVELATEAQDTPEDILEYRWDYGDGETDAGTDLWTTTHAYDEPGLYRVIVEVSDQEGAAQADTVELEVGQGQGQALPEDAVEQGRVLTESVLRASVGGVVGADLEADVRSTMGLYLMRLSSGMCRLTFTAWDDRNLAQVTTWVDLSGLPEEGGRIRWGAPPVYVTFHSDANGYRTLRQLRSGRMEEALRSFQGIDPALANRIGAMVGAVPGGAAEPPDEVQPGTPLVRDRADFRTVGGTLELTIFPYDRIEGVFDLTLLNPDDEHPSARGTISLSGTLGLDLQDALRRGLYRPGDCGPATFEVREVDPVDGEKHTLTRPLIGVQFNAPYDPEMVDETTFQVGYSDPSLPDGFQALPGRILRGHSFIRFVPEEELIGGVRHTIRLKAGEEGVRGSNGSPLEDAGGDGWESWTFETRVDFASPAAPGHNLSCHVYQTIRDAPLVKGKPALVRVYADWSLLAGVPRDAQVSEIEGTVMVRDGRRNLLATTPYTFVRPDLWESAGIDQKEAAHTANVFGWSPTGEEGDQLQVSIRVPTDGGRSAERHFTSCPVTHWDEAPEFVVDYYLLGVNEWAIARGGPPNWAAPAVNAMVAASERYALQLLPIQKLEGRVRGFLDLHGLQGAVALTSRPLDSLMKACQTQCSAELMTSMVGGLTNADVVVGFGPWGVNDTTVPMGGYTQRGGVRGTSFVTVTAQPPASGETFDRLVQGLVHEYGHAFDLEHLPWAPTVEIRTPIVDMRSSPLLWYEGVEGFRIDRGGRRGWNKSSEEGNQQTPRRWLVPLMFPGTIPTAEAFIANHHYRLAQDWWAARGSTRVGAAEPLQGPEPRLFRTAGRSAPTPAQTPRLQEAPPSVTVAGLLDESDEVVLLTGLVRGRRGSGAAADDGLADGYRAALLDAGGAVVSRVTFTPSAQDSDDGGLRGFGFSLEWAESARRFVLTHDGETLIERVRSANPPEVRILQAGAGSTPTVSWEASDPDGDPVEVGVLYAPAPDQPWTVLGIAQPASGTLALDPSTLEPGPSPRFRVVASDGFDQATAEAPAGVRAELTVLAAFPSVEVEAETHDLITVHLNSDLGEVAEGAITLVDDGGAPVELVLEAPAGGRTLTAWPAAELEGGRTYRATLAAGLIDRWGNRLAAPFSWSFRTAP